MNICAEINDHEFSGIQDLLYGISGISLASGKKAMVTSRLSKRLRALSMSSYTEYLELLKRQDFRQELQIAVDLLTTNETYFFRESKHFDFLKTLCGDVQRNSTFRVWSAACSSGQEPYSIAMVLDEMRGNRPWGIVATDISSKVLTMASQGLYPIAQAERIPQSYLSRYCLKGIGSKTGNFMIDQSLRQRVDFRFANLNQALPPLGEFDVIFLRNVLIYFDIDTKRAVVNRLIDQLKPGGCLIIGLSETLNGVTDSLNLISPSLYVKPVPNQAVCS